MNKKDLYPLSLLLVLLLTGIFTLLSDESFGDSGKEGSKTPAKFEFALIGDLLYNAEEVAKFPSLIEDINQEKLAFIVHDGDIKSGSSLCTDEVFENRYELFQTFAHPFVYIFGDNEWTDCHRANNGGYDPLERLEKLRFIFTQGDQSLGERTLLLERQSNDPQYIKFRENVRWIYGKVVFVGLNVPGSNNNFGRTPEADAEYVERNAANLVWLRQAFALAAQEKSRGIMIIIQANPGFELPSTDPNRTGFNDFLSALEQETLALKKPVILVHGDSHNFQINKPLFGSISRRRIENFTRVETFGTPDVHWIRGSVDPKDPNLFGFRQEIVEKNLVNHTP